MTRTAHYKHYHCNVHKASIIELPYKGDFSMFVILPDEKYGLSKMIEEWPKNKLSDYIVEMNKSNRTTGEFVKVHLPKFDVDYSMQLLPLLKSLGADVTTALTPLNPTLIITDAFQSARIKVYEAGTEAAAVTILAVNRSGQGQKGNPIIFKADHPFSYCIRDMRSGINIFCGTVMMFK
ncbi:hypothetical protein B4U80_11683 [Leptotrombidium deliense]|uniref:Serpin domain-containing protein n=1 Tax=Leptotrombidium deliense TaxID=299467 RepID=A0A443S3W6_9ACAR|nr:hypothetical protein B4U80_11683 [Leptotrombidium deliense]